MSDPVLVGRHTLVNTTLIDTELVPEQGKPWSDKLFVLELGKKYKGKMGKNRDDFPEQMIIS